MTLFVTERVADDVHVRVLELILEPFCIHSGALLTCDTLCNKDYLDNGAHLSFRISIGTLFPCAQGL